LFPPLTGVSHFFYRHGTKNPLGFSRAGTEAGCNGFISFLLRKKLTAQKWQGGRTKNPMGFWFSEFGAKPQTPKAEAEGFRPRKG
jgi:hypothetical protein